MGSSAVWEDYTEEKSVAKTAPGVEPFHRSRFMVRNSAPPVALCWFHLQRWSCFCLPKTWLLRKKTAQTSEVAPLFSQCRVSHQKKNGVRCIARKSVAEKVFRVGPLAWRPLYHVYPKPSTCQHATIHVHLETIKVAHGNTGDRNKFVERMFLVLSREVGQKWWSLSTPISASLWVLNIKFRDLVFIISWLGWAII